MQPAFKAYADGLIARHRREVFRINGDAVINARRARDFDRFRSLREVIDPPFGPAPSDGPPVAETQTFCERPEDA